MKYGDFSSVVQLGIGLHVGTAVLQLYGELGVQPLVRVIDRTRSLFLAPQNERPDKAIEDDLDRLESRYEIFKIRLFHEYKKYVIANSLVAAVLAGILIFIAYNSELAVTDAGEMATILLVFLSLFPAPITLGVLWFDAGRQVKPMKAEADVIEKRALASQ